MTLGFYLRLSESDGDLGKDGKDESNSIENQRLLLQSFVEANDELEGEVIEYIDDGYSGTNFNRPAFKRMIEDAKKGIIQVILVKDLSRLGRDYITAGDYIDQIFPMLNVRFIAANNGYDSAKQKHSTASFEVAISNLVNTLYSRDLSRKQKAANTVRWKNGINNIAYAPFGYKKSKTEKGKFEIDPEAAQIVRFIFEAAVNGNNTSEIARMMNEKQFPTPLEYDKTHKNWDLAEPISKPSERHWDSTKVYHILTKYEYTGALVRGQRRLMTIGASRGKLMPKSEWIIVDGVNDAIVSKEEFEQANEVIKSGKKPRFYLEQHFPLKGKIRCGNCRRMLEYTVTTYKEFFVCRNGVNAGKFSECCKEQYPVGQVERVVWLTLKEQLSTLEQLGVQAGARAKTQMKTVKVSQRNTESEIEKLKAEKIRQYEMYAEGIITKDEYVRKKQALSNQIEEMSQQKADLKDEFLRQSELWESAVNLSNLAKEFNEEKKLTRKMVLAFIKDVFVYDPYRIEIVFNFEDEIKKLQESLEKYQEVV